MQDSKWSYYREVGPHRAEEFFNKGYKRRYFFPHRLYFLPKAGPDALKLAHRMCGAGEPNQQWEIILQSIPSLIEEFPEELFFDDDIIWHQQHLGQTGHVAFAYLVIKDGNLYGLNYVSDLVQRISRRREHKTRIEKRFNGWHRMLLNGIVNFARENNLKNVYSPTADLAMENTDPTRTVQGELFERVYDRAVRRHFMAAREGKWWVIDVEANRNRLISPELGREAVPEGRTICVCHDIERGLGHLDVDPEFARVADQVSPKNLGAMLAVEAKAGLKATYNVVGTLLPEVRKEIEERGHCVGFHSYDHPGISPEPAAGDDLSARRRVARPDKKPWFSDQLNRCREIDYRIKGYRPPRSRVTPEISDDKLCFYNFEWLASSVSSLGLTQPAMIDRVVKIPILFDDFDLYKKGMKFDDWARNAVDIIRQNDFVAFSLHDCYAEFWLPFYRKFLDQIGPLGQFKTLTEVGNSVILGSAQ